MGVRAMWMRGCVSMWILLFFWNSIFKEQSSEEQRNRFVSIVAGL